MVHTIFLSYAHDDNLVPERDPRFTGWVDFFHKTLSLELGERSLDCELWRDRRDLDPIAFFDEEIKNAIRDSKILIAIISPRYVEREYCLNELTMFVDFHAEGDGTPGNEPILKVVRRSLSEERQPAPIRRRTGVEFFRIDKEKNEEIPFYEGYGSYQDQEYWRVIRRIGSSIENQLATAPEPQPGNSKKVETVFLAVTSSDLAGQWAALHEEFTSNGYRVVPNQNFLPTEEAIEAGLRGATLSIHLMGETSGFKPDGADTPIVHSQFHVAEKIKTENSQLKRVIWLPQGAQSKDPVHAAFIEKLQKYQGIAEGDEILNGDTVEDLKTVILRELRDHPENIKPATGTPLAPPRVYLIFANEDEGKALELYDVLADAGIEVLLPEFDGDGMEQPGHHANQLASCDGALIYYGEASHAFVQKHVDGLANRNSAGDPDPLSATGAYLASPHTPRKNIFRSPSLDFVIQGADGSDEDSLSRFIGRILQGTGT